VIKIEQHPAIATKEQFIKLNCSDCQFENEDNDPNCQILIKILDGAELKSLVCKNYKKKRRDFKC